MKLPFSRRRALWLIAVCSWAIGIGFTAAMADGPTVVGVQFTWGQVVVLVAIGAAWGEQRQQVKSLIERIKQLEDDVRENGEQQ